MPDLADMLWIEARKALRSKMPLWTGLGSLAMPMGIAFLIFVARNPEISQRMGLISAKANLLAYSATDWPTYLVLVGAILSAGGLFLFVLTISWVFGREFADGTLKDMLAVPVQRATILLAKFIVVAGWSVAIAVVVLIVALVMGALIGLPGGSPAVIVRGSAVMLAAGALSIVVTIPFALAASVGRGYLLPLGVALFMALLTNLAALAGWGEYFPWAVPGLYAQGKVPLAPTSFGIVLLTGIAGMAATYLWWKYADQNK